MSAAVPAEDATAEVWVSGDPALVDGAVIRVAAHELRDSIATILALVEAASSVADPEAVRRYVDRIGEQADLLADTCRTILRSPPQPNLRQPFDVEAHVDRVIEAFRLIRGTSIELIAPGETSAAGHPTAFTRALTNVVDNATRAAGDDGSVEVRVSTTHDEVLVQVDDDGPGFGLIRPGHSLGLPVSAHALAAMGGRLSLGAPSELGGARVVIGLPRSAH